MERPFRSEIDRRGLLLVVVASVASSRFARAEDCEVSIQVEDHGWKGLEPWMADLDPKIQDWWRRINSALGAQGCAARKTLVIEYLRIQAPSVAAAARGDHLLVNAPYVLANSGNPDMLRMMAHELVHVAQRYPNPSPRWLVEGIADYVRYYVLFPDDPGRYFDPRTEDWNEGYSPAAGLLAWVETNWPGSIGKINSVLAKGGAGEQTLTILTGSRLPALWARYLYSKPEAASADKRAAYWRSLRPAA